MIAAKDDDNTGNYLGTSQRVMGESWSKLSEEEKEGWKRVACDYKPILTCVTCDKIFKKERHYRYHIQHCGDFECQTCKKKFNNYQNLKRHILVHQETDFKCSTCGKNF